jgi:2-polyprenyl-3-methyl-5-hydroxy-6-metoxy-1,4-benzoquinol methylase
MINKLDYVKKRQKLLREAIEYNKDFESWEESCVPSYCHPNPFAAGISWMRLFAALELAGRHGPPLKRVLDFGSSIGELGHLLPKTTHYDFIEGDELPAKFLKKQLPTATRTTLEKAPAGAYDHVFAIDSLEHNSNYAELLDELVGKLAPGGVFILSGPTENWLYKFGRKLAGFEGHYHETNIHAIEAAAARTLERRGAKSILPVATLFRVTAWRKK